MGDIFINTHHEMVLWLRLLEFIEDGLDHGRGKFLRRQAITPANHLDFLAIALEQGVDHIKVERIASRAGFLGAVHHGNGFDGTGQSLEEMLHRKRPVQADTNNANLFAFCHQVVDSRFGGFSAGGHDDHHALGIRRADVIKEMVGSAGQLGKLIHGLLNDPRHGGIVRINRLARLEENIRVLGGAAQERVLG